MTAFPHFDAILAIEGFGVSTETREKYRSWLQEGVDRLNRRHPFREFAQKTLEDKYAIEARNERVEELTNQFRAKLDERMKEQNEEIFQVVFDEHPQLTEAQRLSVRKQFGEAPCCPHKVEDAVIRLLSGGQDVGSPSYKGKIRFK